jgi:plasmid stabilization system protein ParE
MMTDQAGGELDLFLLEDARQDLLEIASFHLDLGSPQGAEKITRRILDALDLLKTSPGMGLKLRDPELAGQGFRMLITGNYLSVYRRLEDAVYVYRIIDGRRDYPRIFEEMKGKHQED